jgi:Arc/MetJ-type ribon-helix-helix transcriptional regulator
LKIVTINVPECYLDAIDELTGSEGLYPSRSECIRAAIRKFLLKELERLKQLEQEFEEYDTKKYVRIPIKREENGKEVREFRTYKILRKLT